MRRLLSLVIALMLLTVACGGGGGGDETAGGDQATEGQEAAGGGGQEELEIFSWWTGAGEEAGLLALIDLYQQEHENIKVVNAAVAGGAGTNAKAVLASRMQAGDPPDTFQVHAGDELTATWVAANKMAPLDELYEEEGWMENFPDQLIDLISTEEGIWSVPANIHRSNVMWTNPAVFEEHGVEPPTTLDEFFQVADTLQQAGVTPLALGDKEPWTLLHLWESVLLATAGPEMYRALFEGQQDWDTPEVRESFDTVQRMLEYVNRDHGARNWQDAAELVASGEAAMNVMGDWVAGYFTTDLELQPEEGFGWVASPGTDGSFLLVSDTFGLPEGANSPQATRDWLRLIGSVEGQNTFNPLKGSIPARTDAPTDPYGPYSKSAIEDFQQDTLVPSLAHGSAAPPGFLDQASQVIEVFASTGEVDQAIQGLTSASSQLTAGG